MSQCLANFFCSNNAWFDRPFNLCIVDLINKISTFFSSLFPRQYVLDMLHWSKSLVAWTSFWSAFFDGDDTMDTILDMTKDFLSFVCFRLLPTDVAWDNICFFCSYQVIALEYFFIMDTISSWFSAMDNALLHASGNYPADKKE